MADRTTNFRALRDLPGKLRETVAGLTDVQLDTPYRDGGWTVRQVVHHLADSHMHAYLRMKLMVNEDHPTIKPYDQNVWAANADSVRGAIAPSLDLLGGLQSRWADFLEALPEAAWRETHRAHYGTSKSTGMVTPARLIGFIMMMGLAAPGYAQTSTSEQKEIYRLTYSPRDRTIEFTGGATLPMSHAALTEFWMQGPSLRICGMIKANERTRVGLGVEAAHLSFRRGTFAATYPGVPVQTKHLSSVYIFLGVRNYLRPSVRLTPFIGAEIGVLRWTGAEYKEVIDGVRYTYYEIPGMAHLAGSVSAGVDYFVFRRVALQFDGRALFVLNNAETGLLLTSHIGLKYAL